MRDRTAVAIMAAAILGVTFAAQGRGAEPQQVADDAAAELTRIIGVHIPAKQVVVTNMLESANADAEVPGDTPYLMRVRPWIARDSRTEVVDWVGVAGTHGRRRIVQTMGWLDYIVHETLHRPQTVRCWWNRPLEEGIADAVTADALPTIAWRVYGVRGVRSVPVYTAEVKLIRAASMYATGSPHPRTWVARKWRYQLAGASCAQRLEMFRFANHIRHEEHR